jgi:hypothetical protein
VVNIQKKDIVPPGTISFPAKIKTFCLLGDGLSGLGDLSGKAVAAGTARIASGLAGIASLGASLFSFLSGFLSAEIASNGSTHEGYDCKRHKYLFHCTLNLTIKQN